MQAVIQRVRALQVLDSRGMPTVRAQVELVGGQAGWAAAPSGASTGIHEAHEKRDGDVAFGGKGVLQAVAAVDGPIADALRGMDACDQRAIDRAMIALDGTGDKSGLGANAILAVSLACARAAAAALGVPLFRHLGGLYAREMPVPMMNILNGGAHAGNNLDIQEFMIRPVGARSFAEAVRIGAEIYQALGALLKEQGHSRAVGDEGGYAPSLESDEQALTFLLGAVRRAGYDERTVHIALDIAASEWAAGEEYVLPKRGARFTREQLIEYYVQLTEKFPIDSIEDPLGEDDFEGFALARERLRGVQIVGDDLFTTNVDRLVKGIERKSASAILIKPNQIGTLSETFDAVRLAQKHGLGVVVSHRSGETEDSFIADLSVAVNAGQIKTGAPARAERTCKYNRLLEIERLIQG